MTDFAFINFLNSYKTLDKKIENEIIDLLKFESFKKGELLLKSGKICNRIYFLEKGTIRSFFYKDLKDITYWIIAENQLFTGWNSFVHQVPVTESFETIEDCTLSSLTYEQWHDLLGKYKEIEFIYRRILEEQIASIDEFYRGYFFMTAKEKYDLLIQAFPRVTQISNLKHIASMLGISQETLSRIRSLK